MAKVNSLLQFKLHLKIICTIAIASLVVAALYWSYKSGLLRFNYPAPAEFPVRGIDVSHHQGPVDWQKVAGSGIRFAFIKATEGGNFRDHEFQRNWKDAALAGISRGAYHYYSLSKSGEEQARNFLEAVPPDGAALPPVVDFETIADPKTGKPKETVVRELADYIRRIETAHKRPVLIYTTHEVYGTYLAGSGIGNGIWIRDIFGKPTKPGTNRWIFWQYANNGRVSGIRGPVDLNVYRGSVAQFKALATAPDKKPVLAESPEPIRKESRDGSSPAVQSGR